MKNPGPDITSSKKPILISSFEPMWKLCHLASSSLPLHCKPFLDTNCCKLSLDPPQAQLSLIHALVLIGFCAQTPLPFMVRQVSYPSGINTRRWDGVWNKNNHVDITCM